MLTLPKKYARIPNWIDDALELPFDCPWRSGARRLWNVWQMIDLYGSIFVLLRAIESCQFEMVSGMVAGATDGQNKIQGQQLDDLHQKTRAIKSLCIRLEISSALERIERIERALDNPHECAFVFMRDHFRTLRENVEDNLTERIFWYVPLTKIRHLEAKKDLPFKEGPELRQAREEYFEAERCFALERYTGCMAHASRLAELCLRSLGRHLVGEKIGNRPIEFVDWKPMLTAVEPKIEEKLKQLDNEPRTPERERANRFYTDALSHLAYFKSLRDEVSHARALYDEGQALSALLRVKEFAKLMADGML